MHISQAGALNCTPEDWQAVLQICRDKYKITAYKAIET